MAFYNPYRTRPDDEKVTQPNFGGVRSVSFTDPTTINRQRALADSLRQQSMTPLNMGTAGGYVIPPSPMQGIAKLGEAAAAVFAEKKAREKEEANKQLNTNLTSEMLRRASRPVVERRPKTVDGQPVTQSQLMSSIRLTEIADAYSPEALTRASAIGLGDPNASDATKQLAWQLQLKAMEQAHGIKKAESAAVAAEKTRTKDMEDYKEKEKYKNSLIKDKEPQNIQIFKTLYPDLDLASPDGIAAYDRLFGKTSVSDNRTAEQKNFEFYNTLTEPEQDIFAEISSKFVQLKEDVKQKGKIDFLTIENEIENANIPVEAKLRLGELVKEIKTTTQPEADKQQQIEENKAIGKNIATVRNDLAEFEANLPRLQEVVEELGALAEIATYTEAGLGYDAIQRQLGMDMNKGAIARKEYISKVDNEILPLLRQTFGAQFTVQEGETLKRTLGDPNASPEEKKAVLKSFIENKIAQIEIKRRLLEQITGGKDLSMEELMEKYKEEE